MLLGVMSEWKLLVCFIMCIKIFRWKVICFFFILLGVISKWRLLVCFIMLFRRIKIFQQKLMCFFYAKYLYKKKNVLIASFTILLSFWELWVIRGLLCVRDISEKSLNRLLLLLILKTRQRRCSVKKVLYKILPISQENTYLGVSF